MLLDVCAVSRQLCQCHLSQQAYRAMWSPSALTLDIHPISPCLLGEVPSMQPLQYGSKVFFTRQVLSVASQWSRFVNSATRAIWVTLATWRLISRLQLVVRFPSPTEIRFRLLAFAKVATG